MHKDANLLKRNALVIPGGLLAFYGVVGILYAAVLRSPSDTCPDSGALIWIGGACRSALLVLAIPLVLGLALVGVGALAFRSKASCRHGHGSWTHFTLALLVSLVLVPILAWVLSPSLVGPDAAFTRGGVDYPLGTILAGIAGLGFLMLLPFAILYFGQTRFNPCCAEKGCFSPCFCDEPAAEEPEAAAEPPVVEPATGPVAATTPSWDTVPEPTPALLPAVPPPVEEPPVPAPAPVEQAPALTARPTDPAAPPSDGMAEAAKWIEEDQDNPKWAEEDEEALAELGETGAPRRRSKPAKKVAKKKASGKR